MALHQSQSVSARADLAAAKNWAANLRALSSTQPALVEMIQGLPAHVTWVYGRDGSLTAQVLPGRWLGGCSLPMRAAQAMLKTLVVNGTVACLLPPPTAGLIRTSLDKMQREQAVISIAPDLSMLRVLLACDDFSGDIDLHRLWFVTGENWKEELDQLFESCPGLPTPAQFIRPSTATKEMCEAWIPAVQEIITRHNEARTEKARQLVVSHKLETEREKWCVIAPSKFRLWDDAGEMLAGVLSANRRAFDRLDPDDPSGASALKLAEIATGCDALIVANAFRSELPALPEQLPIITWLTAPRFPAFDPRFAKDGLLLADPTWRANARTAGWPAQRLGIAGWPMRDLGQSPAKGDASLVLLADTLPIETPKFELSSQNVLWEMIELQLRQDAFTLGADIGAYLSQRMKKLSISHEAMNVPAFVDRLILPAYQQALARTLIESDVPLQLFGSGWESIKEFRPYARGPVATTAGLLTAIAAAGALVYAEPFSHAHAIETFGKPVIRPGRQKGSFLKSAREALRRQSARSSQVTPAIGADAIAMILT